MARKKAEPGTGGNAAPADGETARDEAIGALPETPPEHDAAPEPDVDPASPEPGDSFSADPAAHDPAAELPEGPETPLSDLPEPPAANDPAPAEPLAASAPEPDPWGTGEIDPARIAGNDPVADPYSADPLSGGSQYGDPLHVDPLAVEATGGDTYRGDPLDADPLDADSQHSGSGYGDPLEADPYKADPLDKDTFDKDPLDKDPLDGVPAVSTDLHDERDPLDPPPSEPVEPADPWVRADEPAVAAQPVPPVVETEVVEEDVAEDHGWSAAAKALAALVLLSLGAVGGIWAAPRIAPHLPAGMAPVAAWLTPGGSEAEARLAALDAQVQSEVGALKAQVAGLPTPDALRGEAQTLVGQTRDSLTADIAALRDQLGDPAQRFGQIESTLSGVGAELATLKGQIESGTQALGGTAAASIDTYRAELDGLRAEVGRLSGEVGALNGRLDQAETAAQTRVSAAEAAAATAQQEAAASVDVAAAQADIARIRAALVSGAPFQAELDSFAQASGATIPEALTAAAATGVATETELESEFSEAAHAAIRTNIVASAGDGFWNRTKAFVEAQVASRALSPQEGSSPDAVLSRVEAALKKNDLATAVQEAQTLPTEAREAMGGWIAQAKLRADAEAGLADLSAAPNMN